MSGLRSDGLRLALAGAVLFVVAQWPLHELPRRMVSAEMQIALPRFVQVIMACGDRYLAANLAGFRALVASTEHMERENYRVQGIVQSDIAWLNPAHEDNYYIAAAILPWNGEVDATQDILSRAAKSRPFDWQPAFYYAFDELHFRRNPEEAAKWLQVAARGTKDEAEQLEFQQLAALWSTRGEDRRFAIQLHRAMAKETRHKEFAAFLQKRVRRLENLALLEDLVERYKKRFGKVPTAVEDLQTKGLTDELPKDPFGMSYSLDDSGKPQVGRRKGGGVPGEVGQDR